MKIGIISRVLLHSGNLRWALGFASGFTQLGHETKVIFLRGSADDLLESDTGKLVYEIYKDKQNISRVGLALLRMKWFENGFPKESAPDPLSWVLAPARHRWNREFDLLVLHDQYIGMSGLIAHELYNIPYVVFTHEPPSGREPFALRFLLEHWQSAVFKNALLRCSVSPITKEICERRYRLPFELISHGCSPDKSINGSKGNYVLFDTRWSSTRDPFLIIKIARALKGVKAVVAGSFPNNELQREFERSIISNDLSDTIILRLNSGEKELKELFRKAIAYVRWPAIAPDGYKEAGPSFGIFQSMEVGCPIIVTEDLASAKWLQSENAAIVTRHEGLSIATTINKLDQNRSMVNEMALNSWQLGVKNSWKESARKVIEAL